MKHVRKGIVAAAVALLVGSFTPRVDAEPADICRSLITAGAASSCTGTSSGTLAKTVHFGIVGLDARYQGTIFQYKDRKTFYDFLQGFTLIPPAADDYPNQYVADVDRLTIITWSTTDGSHDAWDACRDRRAVAVCAREQAALYGSFQRLHEATMGALRAPVRAPPKASDGSEGLALCLTPFVLIAIIGIVVAFILRNSHKDREKRRQAAVAAMHAQEQRNAWHAHQQGMQRLAALAAHFGPTAAERIMRNEIWQGQTEEMLRASRGVPVEFDETVLKTKTKRTYKYEPRGANRFAFRVFVEDGVVVGWEDKR